MTRSQWTVSDEQVNRETHVSLTHATGYKLHVPIKVAANAPKLYETLRAILARINGEWDCPELRARGELRTDAKADIRAWADAALAEARVERL